MTAPTLVPTTTRLLQRAGADMPLGIHQLVHGSFPRIDGPDLIAAVEASGLTGRGGGSFPAGRKLRTVAGARNPIVIGNGCEGEPASGKDGFLLQRLPHLVLDGLVLAASAVGSSEVHLAVASPAARRRIELAIGERRAAGLDPIAIEVLSVPAAFLSGEESALVNAVEGRGSLPRATLPRVFDRGAYGRPTLVQNVETLAHIALIARYGADWFREVGSSTDPGTMLVTISGAVHQPGIAEVPRGASLGEIVSAAGGPNRNVQAILVGGYHGTWVTTDIAGCSLGAGVVVVLPTEVCGLVETARAVSYLAAQSAGQCGPCLNGLPALAGVFGELAVPVSAGAGRSTRAAADRIWELAGLVERRGACHHPDGTARFVRSALVAFEAELALHAEGLCCATSSERILPTPSMKVSRR